MAHTSSHGAVGAHGHGPKLNHETTDIPLTGTTRSAIVTLVVIGLIMLFVYGVWQFFESRMAKVDQPVPALAEKDYGRRLPPAPRLQSTPADDLTRYRAAQETKLRSYGWVDKNAGVVRIPIERAIEIMAERASTIADPKAADAAPAAPAAAPAPPSTTSQTPAPATGH
jgi:hypothetical protein